MTLLPRGPSRYLEKCGSTNALSVIARKQQGQTAARVEGILVARPITAGHDLSDRPDDITNAVIQSLEFRVPDNIVFHGHAHKGADEGKTRPFALR